MTTTTARPVTTCDIETRKTRAGAESFIRNLAYEPGVEQHDTSWDGSAYVPVSVRFDVEQRSPKAFVVVRTIRYSVQIEEN
jgi:hypothetical protein